MSLTPTAPRAIVTPEPPVPVKLLCAQSDLNANLSLVSRAVPSRPTHPVLANVLLTCDAGTQRVSLTAFDLSFGIQTSFPAEVDDSGEITLPAKLLADIVSRLPNGALTLELTDESTAILTAQSGRYSIQGMGAEEFTALPVVENGEPAYLPVDALLEGLRGALFAASSDETKQVLTGVHLSVKGDSLEFAATDGHRLAVVKAAVGGLDEDGEELPPLEEFEVTVPGRTLRELERILSAHHADEPVALYFDRGQVAIQWSDYYITSRTLEGQYPAYQQLIPRQFDRQLTVDRKALLASLERIAVLADQKSNHIVKFEIDSAAQRVCLSADAQDVGSGREFLESVQISGDDLEIAFNVRYLMESLKNLQSTEVQVQLNTPTSPVVLSPLGGIKATHLVMPVQVRS
ncbi:MAG: DNA polymerase III subunit beta [Cyanophyceae cyanobacterium]